jgi:hypothetical protein
MSSDLVAASRLIYAYKAGGTLLAALVLWLSVSSWYDANLYAQLSAQSPAVSVKVLSTKPVTVAPPGGEAVKVKGAPDGLRPDSTISVFYDAQDLDTVFYASADAGLKTSVGGATRLLLGGSVSWVLLLFVWVRLPNRRVMSQLATGTVREGVIAETLERPRPRPRLRDRLLRPRLADLVVEYDDDTHDVVTVVATGDVPEGRDRVPVTVHTAASGAVAVRLGDRTWWPAPKGTPTAVS